MRRDQRTLLFLGLICGGWQSVTSGQCLEQVLSDSETASPVEGSRSVDFFPTELLGGPDWILRGNGTAGLVELMVDGAEGFQLSVNTYRGSPGFGSAVAGGGSNFVIGNPLDSSEGPEHGSVQTYLQLGPGFVFEGFQLPKFPSRGIYGHYGAAVSMSGSWLVIGEPDPLENVGVGGRAYIHREILGKFFTYGWINVPLPGVRTPLDEYGYSVGITSLEDGAPRDAVIVGAPGATNAGTDSGAWFVFVRDNDFSQSWSLNSWGFLPASAGFRLGSSVAIDGDHAVVGAPGADLGGPERGLALFLRWNGSEYVPSYQYTGERDHDRLGASVDLDDGIAVLGLPGYDRIDGSGSDSGAVRLVRATPGVGFDQLSSPWPAYPTGVADGDRYGASVAVHDGRAVVDAPGSDAACTDCGTSYLSTLELDTWQWDFSLGGAGAGSAGPPGLLAEGSLCPDEEFRLLLTHVPPETLAWLVLGLSELAVPHGGAGGLLVPFPDALVGPFLTDSAGRLEVPLTIAGPLPGPLPIWFQFWIVDGTAPGGLSSSNGIVGTVP